jgi:glutathione S-transferase
LDTSCNQVFLRGYPSAVILTHTRSFSSSVMETHCDTSATVRPQPRHTSSKVVEQTATQGVSGREGREFCIIEFLTDTPMIGETVYKLYYYPGNANLAPHMLLEELGAEYELVLVDCERNEQKSAEYLKLNPNGRIPTLIDGDLVLYETAAICLHLVDRHPDAGLAPAVGSAERAEFYKWMVYLTNTLQAELITYFYPERLTDDEATAARVKAHAEARVAGMLDLIETTFAMHCGPYLLGARYSAVDPYLLMLSRWTRMMGNPARNRHHLGRYLERVAARPAIQRAFAGEGLGAPLF